MTYEYKCDKCDKVFEVIKPNSESSRIEYCKVCKSEMRRIYSTGAISTGDGFKR